MTQRWTAVVPIPTPPEIAAALPGLMSLREDIRAAGREPSAVVLPARLDPGAYDGPDATDMPAMLMGLPVIWGDRTGLVYVP